MSIKFKRGDIVDANGEIAVIMDVLRSADTDNLVLKVRFIRNIGDSRPYDTLDLTPAKAKIMRVDQWQPATRADLEAAIEKRRKYLEQEIADLLVLAQDSLSAMPAS